MQPDLLPEDINVHTRYPLLSERIQSTFIDTIFIVILMFIFASVLDRFENVPDGVRITLFVLVWIVYDPVCTSLGFTLGNYIKGLRVRQHENVDKKINVFQAALRYLIKIFLGWISFLTINTNKEKRALHDFVAGSVVIKV
ncbi:MAG: RDD family protein [Agriterribacter sp.]